MPRNTGSHHPYDAGEDYFYRRAAAKYNAIAADIDQIANAIEDEPVTDRRRVSRLFAQLVGERIDEENLRPSPGIPSNASEREWFDQRAFAAYQQGRADARDLLEAAGYAKPSRSITESTYHRAATERVFRRQRRYWRQLADDVEEQVQQAVYEALGNDGATIRTAKDTVADRIEHVGKYRARLIAESESATAYNEALVAEYEDAGVSDVSVEKINWVTAGDERVCADCAAMSGTYTLREAKDLLKAGEMPHHVRCRCVFIPA